MTTNHYYSNMPLFLFTKHDYKAFQQINGGHFYFSLLTLLLHNYVHPTELSSFYSVVIIL